jgi:PAS domain S-box-containing protein
MRKSGDEKYRSIFEHSAVSLWEEDISRLRSKLSDMRRGRGFSLRTHMAAHPQFVQEALALIEVTDVNQASLRLFEADRKQQLLGPLSAVLDAVSQAALADTILAIDEGQSDIEAESSALTLTGKKLSLIAKTHIPPANAAYPCMIVSLIDITARKEAEERERQGATILHSIIESSPDAIHVKDRSLRMVLCNSAHSRSIGKEPSETYGKTDIENGWNEDLVHGNPKKGIAGWEKDDLAALSGMTIQTSSVPSNVDDAIRYFDAVKMPLRDKDGVVIGIIGIGRDVTERRKNEEQLRASEESYRDLMEQAPDGILVIDESGNMVMVNSALCEMLGYDRRELLRKNLLDTYPDEMRNEGMQRLNQVRAGHPQRYERPMKKKDGSLIQVAGSARRLENGLLQGIMHDITKETQAEAALAWERSLFNLLMENLPDYIYFKDLESRFTRTSWSHARVLGLRDPAEAVGKTDADFYGADHARKALADEENVIRSGTPLVNIEERETYPDRPDTWAITTKMPLRNARGEIIGTFGITHDITKRKQLEEKNQQLAALVESAEDAIVGLDLNRRITVWNRGAERLYGYSAEEMIGAPTSVLIPPDLEEEARIIRERIMRGEQITQFETTRLRKDGSKIIVSLTLSAVRDPEGRIVGMASVARDITAEKALQVQLNRAQRLEGLATLARGVAHQFNNINTVVRGYLDLLRSEGRLPARLASYVEAASAGVRKAVDITDRLLALTEAAGGSLNTVRLDVLARGLLPLHQKRIEEEKIQLVLNLAETAPVQGDEKRMKFVLSCLIGNALDSLLDRPSRMVSIRTGNTKDAAYFEIEDSGCGISAEDLTRIFSPFFSAKGEWAAPGSSQAKLKGVGLSLAISSTTVSEYGGMIEVQSTSGAGSTFRVVMPIAQPGA